MLTERGQGGTWSKKNPKNLSTQFVICEGEVPVLTYHFPEQNPVDILISHDMEKID